MKKVAGAAAVCLVFALILLIVLYYRDMWKQYWERYEYQESMRTLRNPDRGLYIQADIQDEYAYASDFEPQLKLRLLTMNLFEFQETDVLPETKIEQLRNTLEEYRKLGLTVIFRAGYFFGEETCTEPSQFETILNHARQICPILNEYQDVVQVVQAGFIGPYGEWHSSPYMERRMELLACLNQELSMEISIALRRPMFVREAEAEGMEISRFAIHNDAFLSSDTDMGTYVEEGYDRDRELKWVERHIQSVMNGGEMTNLSFYTQVKNAVAEMKQINMTYLNGYYNTEILKDWRYTEYMGQNACAYIVNHLGYRLSLKDLSVLTNVNRMQQMKFEGSVKNTGFAMPQDKYKWYVIISDGTQEKMYPLYTSIKGDSIKFSFQTDIWQDFSKEAALRVGICITRDENSSQNYSIELANDDIIYEKGINWFGRYEIEKHEKWPNAYQYVFRQILGEEAG